MARFTLRRRSPHLRRFLLASGVILAASLIGIHLRYPLPYVYRVLAFRDSDFSDIDRFPARSIAAPGVTSALPIALDPEVVHVIEQHPRIEALDPFLEETETTALLIARGDRLVVERYLHGHDRESFQNTFSVSKSFVSALVGAAVFEGAVDLDAPITRYLPELEQRDARFARITVEHLLDMRSGIRYSPATSFPFVNADDALIYYYLDLASLVLERTSVASAPGDFKYNNYNPPLLGLILRRTTGMPVAAYLERVLWRPMGAEHEAGWTTDDHGFERMESGFHACARDLVRFGLLYLHDGLVEDRRVLPETWVRDSTDLPGPWGLEDYDGRKWGYRLGWWIVPRPEGRSDSCAIGRYGQFIYVSPQYDVVFVRTGPDRGSWSDFDWTELFYFVAERLPHADDDAANGSHP